VPEEKPFKLRQVGRDIAGKAPEEPSEKIIKKPPKAVYVKRDRKELYEHKLEMKPFNWFDQKGARDTF